MTHFHLPTQFALGVLLLCAAAVPALADAAAEASEASTAYALNSHTVALTDTTFAQTTEQQNVIVLFQSTECSECAEFIPRFERLAEQFADNTNVRFATVSCVTFDQLCADQKAIANDLFLYPAATGQAEPRIKFVGLRDVDGLARFLIKHLGDDVLDGTAQDVPRSLASVQELNGDNFKQHVASGEHFVKFYAPWCGHCQRLAPTWEELATVIEPLQTVSVSQIDCTQHRPICVDFEVKGYPSLLWIVDGVRQHKYTGARNVDELQQYVLGATRQQPATADAPTVQPPTAEGVLVLTGETFDAQLEHGVTFVKFYAPWCGHCKRMAPTWSELADKFVDTATVKIAKVDCTDQASKELCGTQEVNGFPTLYIYKDGQKLQEYNGNRSLEDLVEFVQRYTSRDEL